MDLFITVYSIFFIAFTFYFLLLYNRRRVEVYLANYASGNKVITAYVGLEKIAGFLLMGVLPFIALSLLGFHDFAENAALFSISSLALKIIVICAAVILTINFMRAGKPANHALYPQVRAQRWGIGLLAYYFGGWALYLLGYEYLFRGLLFFAGFEIMPLWLNITVNCILYALAHLPKGKLEIIASLPFGVLLCLISYETGNFWAAYFIHLTLAASNSAIALRANPQMTVSLRKF